MENTTQADSLEPIYVSKICRIGDISDSIRKGFGLWTDIKLDSNSVVLIKPNLCSIKSHETGTTTDPKIVFQYRPVSDELVSNIATLFFSVITVKNKNYENYANH